MPAHFTVATHSANQVKTEYWRKEINTAADLLDQSWGGKHGELLQSSIASDDLSSIRAQRNGFFHAAIAAYGGHHHLVFRPDDVWIAILAQLNCYVNAHAEELRSQFVRHEGKKELNITAVGTRYTVDVGALVCQMTAQIQKHVIDEELKDWILPDFSTTSSNDTVTCAIIMMATMKTYFIYQSTISCGIPSVTLEGEKADWEKLVSRLDKLPTFGPEPAAWAKLLRPILRRFVQAFDGEPDVDFWGKICHHHDMGCGMTYLSGWITTFAIWSNKGKWQGPPLALFNTLGPTDTPRILNYPYSETTHLTLDGVLYPVISWSSNVSIGYCGVGVKLDDNGEEVDCTMVSGHVGYRVEGNEDTLRPFPAWFMFMKGKPRKA